LDIRRIGGAFLNQFQPTGMHVAIQEPGTGALQVRTVGLCENGDFVPNLDMTLPVIPFSAAFDGTAGQIHGRQQKYREWNGLQRAKGSRIGTAIRKGAIESIADVTA
jgi:hypothetical protein